MAEKRDAIFQFDLRAVLALIVCLAITCTAIASGGYTWLYLFNPVLILLVGGALVASVASTGPRRTFWFAFVVFTCLYLLAANNNLGSFGIRHGFPIVGWVSQLVRQIHPDPQASQTFPGMTVYNPNARAEVAYEIAIKAFAILFGFVAAYISRAVYVLAERRDSSES